MKSKLLQLWISLCLICFLLPAASPAQAASSTVATPGLLQFQSAGHVLGFAPGKMYVSNGTYALQLEFAGAAPVAPQAADSGPTFTKVTYPNLWPGITLAYDAQDGLARSTYTLAPGADPDAIRLRYNTPVAIQPDGSLAITYASGQMIESPPLAWQEIAGRRVAVAVAFRSTADSTGFRLGRYDARYPLVIDPTLTWNTFLGGSGWDVGYSIAVDGSGNVYVAGTSDVAWGSPLRAYTASNDAFVAKLSSGGSLIWNTFLGGSGWDEGYAIAVDSSGSVYVTGTSDATWGSPLRVYTGSCDAYLAKLGSDGSLVWNTFLGGGSSDYGSAIAVDSSASIYIAGYSDATWGSPLRIYAATDDAFVAKLGSDGSLTWNTFLGGSSYDYGDAIAVDGSGGVYVTGYSSAAWGSPKRAYTGYDAFVAKLGSDGSLIWNTFLGGSNFDHGNAIAVDSSGSVYIAGNSGATWGSPLRAYTAYSNAFVAKLGSDGSLTWNTFLGGGDYDYGNAIAVDSSGDVYVAGYSSATWGSPRGAFSGYSDTYVAKLGSDGNLTWHAFFGGGDYDYGQAIAVDSSGGAYVAGTSYATWGSPSRAYSGNQDAFVARLPNIYYSQTSGDSVTLANWNTVRGGGEMSPTSFTQGDTFVVQNGHTLTPTADWALSGSGLQIESGGGLDCGPYALTGSGDFSLTAGASLGLGSVDGISPAGTATGNIQLSGPRTFDPAANYTFTGAAAQITGAGFPATVKNLTLSNPAGVTLSSGLTVNGALDLTSGNLSSASFALTLGSSATCSGGYDVLGTTRRTHAIATGTAYCLGNPNTQVTVAVGSSVPGSLSAALTTGTAPFTGAAQRRYTLTAPGFSGSATLRLHYQDAELAGLAESNLDLYRYNPVAGLWNRMGHTGAVDVVDHWAELSGVDAFSDWTLGDPVVTAVDLYDLKAHSGPSPFGAWLVGLLLGCGLVMMGIRK